MVFADWGTVGVMVTEPPVGPASEPTLREVSEALIAGAGDAAHVHYPAGGQGLNLGVQDAVNLGWKLAQVVRRTSPDRLLVHYDLGPGHPLLGRRVPDLDLVTANGALRVYTLLRHARPVLLNLGEPGGFDIAWVGDRSEVGLADALTTWFGPPAGAARTGFQDCPPGSS